MEDKGDELEGYFENDFNFTRVDPKIIVPEDLEPLLYPNAVLGYRAWRIFTACEIASEQYQDAALLLNAFMETPFAPEDPKYLYPMIQEEPWRPNDCESECYNTSTMHEAPGANCNCGWNAFRDIERALEYKGLGWFKNNEPRVIVGAIAGSGRTQLHADGWRAEQAVILGLCNLPSLNNESEHIASISQYYNVPVFDNKKDLETYALNYASPPAEVEIYPGGDF